MSTKNSKRNDADLCREYGWTPGTRLTGDEGSGPTVIEITAVGERSILAKMISHKGKNIINPTENTWTLRNRDWAPAHLSGEIGYVQQ